MFSRLASGLLTLSIFLFGASVAVATPFTTTVPGTSLTLPSDYPEAGGVAFVLVGNNGNLYYQFSNPAGAFRGFNSNGEPVAFRGNPFTINNPLTLDCGFTSCTNYFGGGLQQVHIRFTAFDGDTQPGGFDEDDISLILNGFNVGSWSGLTTEITDTSGTQSFGFATGFGNNTFNTGWFSSSNQGLLNNILTTNQTTTQVLDDDPNDNFWDFRRGSNLANQDIVTVAPGYTLEKTGDRTVFTTVGETVNYSFVVTNIGSVPIRNLSVSDDVIGAVSCDKSVILDTNPGGTADFATCTASYQTTQADLDRGFVTNTATAIGTPDFGELGTLSDEWTVTAPAAAPVLFVEKSTSLTTFPAAGASVPYSILVRNDGNVTLSDFVVDDPLLPGLVCNVPDLGPTQSFTCSGNYTVQQSDVDGFINAGSTLDNTVTVKALTPTGAGLSEDDSLSLDGPAAAPSLILTKTALTSDYDSVGDVLTYRIRMTNDGNVTYPIPAVSDPLTGGATCPAGNLAPGQFVECSASYTVDQDDIDNGLVENTASASVTVGGVTDSASAQADVPAVRRVELSLDKVRAPASPANFNAPNIDLTYEYILTNTGNVKLLSPSVADNRVGVTCSATEILPGASVTCTSAAYSTTQANLNAGGVTNTATATATEAGPNPNTVTSNTDALTIPAVQEPEMLLEKTAPVLTPAQFVAGTVVTYTFDITNTGNVQLNATTAGGTQVTITDDQIGTFNCVTLNLNRNQTKSCTATYTLTPADVLAGQVINTATATVGAVTSNQAVATIAPTFMPEITLDKTAVTADVDATTDTILYQFLVTNTGDTTLTLPGNQISVNDSALTSAADCSAQPASFATGDSFICTGERVGITQGELDAGQVDNAATASFDFTNGGSTIAITSNQDVASVPVVPLPDMVFSKAGPAQFDTVGQVIAYTFTVQNTGNVTLASVDVTDPLIPGLACTLTSIAPGTSDSCTGNYTVTQDDIDAEVINNTASATATPAQGTPITDTANDTTPINPATPGMSASIDKQPSINAFSTVGEQILYTMVVQNTGTQTLSNLVVTDILDAGFSCSIASLAPGQSNSDCTFTYTIQQSDIDAGSVGNTATVDSPEITADSDTETVTGPTRVPSFDFLKSASGGYSAVGDVLSYTFRVENTGNVTLSNIDISDPLFGTPFSCTIPSLLPGQVDNTTCQVSHTIDQGDIDAGSLSNTASVTVDAPAGVNDPADQDSTAVSQGPIENAAVSIDKASTDGSFASATDSETYTFTVTNDGNVTLTNLVVNDPALGFSCPVADLLPGASTSQCADTSPLQAVKNFDQGDVDAGAFVNTATVTGQSAGQNTSVSDSDEETVTGPAPAPGISLAKNSTFVGTMDTVGQILTYDYVITNTGNITLTANISVTDDRIADVNCPAIPPGGIAPGSTLTCTGEYVVTLADLDAGQVVNVASATLTQPLAPQAPGGNPFEVVTSNTDDATVTADQQPALRIEKRVKASSASSYSAPNDVVTFEYVVTNIGNVTTTDDITVTDDQIPGTLTCTTAPLAPNASVTCEQDWIAEQGDIDTGEITNTATADTIYDGVPVASDPDNVTINAVQNPELGIEKTFVSTDRPGFFDVGDNLSYSIVVTNLGNVTIDGPITLSDNLTTVSCPPLVNNELVPGETLNCTSAYTVTNNDLDLGASTNVVSATGSFDGSPVQSPSDDAIYPVDAEPALSVTKTALGTNVPFDTVGQTITYEYEVTNTGNIGLGGEITIVDDVIGTFVCKTDAPPALFTAGPDSTVTCQATYDITQADLDRGFVTNNATAQTIYPPAGPNPTQVVSPNVDATVSADETPGLTVSKDMVSGQATASLNDTLTYEITALNTGNQTISGVSISDALLPSLTCSVVDVSAASSPAPANVVLLPGEALVCEGDYVVTQDDVDAQELLNTASATGTDPQGATVGSSDDHSQPIDAPVVAMTVDKAIFPDPGAGQAFTDPGQELTFVISVTNDGNITLNSATITDSRLVSPTSCVVGPILPGQTNTECEFTYTVTQADQDADNGAAGSEFGGFTNTASATAVPNNPNLDPITEDGSVFVRGPPQEPGINLIKESTTTEIKTFNQSVIYTYTIANTGNVTLFEPPVITDDKIGTFTCTGIPAGGLPPSEFYQCTAEYFVTQEDLDSGGVTNTASATSSEFPDTPSTSLTINGLQTPGVSIAKSASPAGDVAEGETVTYTYTVVNTGNVTLTDVTLVDQHTSAAGTISLPISGESLTGDVNETGTSLDSTGPGIWSTLGPGDTVTFEAEYTVTLDDIDQQITLSNTATITGTPPAGGTVEDDATETVSTEAAVPALEALKVVNPASLLGTPEVGDVVTFDITITNTGNQTLNGIVLSDTLERNDGTSVAIAAPVLISGDVGVAGEMLPDEVWTYRATHTLTQEDIDAGGINNQVKVDATSPSGTPVTDLSDDDNPANGTTNPTNFPITPMPGIAADKTIQITASEVGEMVTFRIDVTNTGNVTLSNVGIASDTLTRLDGTPLTLTSAPIFTGASLGSGAGMLSPNEVATYTATYTLTQADIDAGGVQNSATVTGTPPTGSPVTDVSDDANDADGNTEDDQTQLLIAANPSIGLNKAVSEATPATYQAVGEEVVFEFTVENTGNVTLQEAVSIVDPLITDAGQAITCPALPAGGLPPGDSIVCGGSYFVTQEDIDAGSIDNSATAETATLVSDPSTASIPALPLPELTLLKEGPDLDAADFITNTVVTFTFTTTNTGNTTIFDPITITDALIDPADISCPTFPSTGLAPTEVYICTGDYTVNASDVNLGSVTNIASASDGTTTSELSSATVPNDGEPSLDILKEVTETGFEMVGDELSYTFTVTNSGTRAFVQDIVVTDTLIGDITCFTSTPGDPELAAGESVQCEGVYAVTQDDLDAGFVLNEAFASTMFGADDTQVLSMPGDVRVDAMLTPELTIEKQAATLPVTAVDQVLSYTITVTNTGNQRISNVVATDALLDGFTCEQVLMEPDDVLTCTGTYTVMQSDIDTGTLSNTAEVSGITPQGAGIGDDTTLVVDMPEADPSMVLSKTATPTPFGPVDSTLTYLFSVENTGNVSLNDVTVTDVLDPTFSCVIPTILPGTTNQTCSLAVPVTQDMVDAGSQFNEASATGTDPFGTEVDDTTTLTTDGPERLPAMEITKIALPTPGIVGAVVPFVVTVENTGNVTLSSIALVDVMTDGNGTSVTLDAPFALTSSTDLGADGELSVGETWTYTAEVTLTQEIVNSGGLQNQVTGTAGHPAGGTISDASDDGDDSDGNTSDDPTRFEILAEPALSVIKTVETVGTAVGDEVVFLITATNIGNVGLTGVTVSDTLTNQTGAALTPVVEAQDVPEPLNSGAEATWLVRYTLTQADLDAGGLSNTATVSGTTPDDTQISDVSSDNDFTDGNVSDDPTLMDIEPLPGMEIIKTPVTVGLGADETVTYEVTVQNTGTVTLNAIALVDTVTDLDGANPRNPAASFVSADGAPASPEGTLVPGETATYTVEVVLLQSDIESGGLSNTVTGTGQSVLGDPVEDVSDDDGVGDDDPTRVDVVPNPSLSVEKAVANLSILFPTVEQLTFQITVLNTGNVIQTGIDVADDLAAFVAPATLLNTAYPPQVAASGFTDGVPNPAFDGQSDTALLAGNPTLAPGETGTVTLVMTYSSATGRPAQNNIASATSDQLMEPATGTAAANFGDTDGDGVLDLAESPTEDRDGDGIPDSQDYDPTGYFYCEENGAILSGGQISVTGNGFTQTGVGTTGPITIVQDGSTGFFQFYVTAGGSYTLGLSYPTVGVPSTTRTSLGTLDASDFRPDGFVSVGSSEFGATGVLADPSAGANQFYTSFDIEAGDPQIMNNNIPVMACGGASNVLATKVADRTTAVFGETINYTLNFRNDGSVSYADARLVDRLPAGLAYTPGTARLNGVSTEPVISGGEMVWTADVLPAQTVSVTFAARVLRTGGFGVRSNRAWLETSGGTVVSNVAQADVRIDPEAVFDCSDVIGKVFDDRNSNGYQDDGTGAITNQDYGGKLKGKLAPEPAPTGEPGLAGVRLVTPDGLLITTDAYGRFSVPCAALPRDIGSNFQLKLDTRTLPTGYRVTTENPRNIRLTAGKIAKMNFGASLSQVVRINLQAAGFAGAAPSAELAAGIDGLLPRIATTPSVLRLTYVLGKGEPPEAARARLKSLEQMIRRKWRGTGKYKLIIERTVTRAGE